MREVGQEMVHVIPWSLDVARIMFVLQKHGVARIHLLNPVESEKSEFTRNHKEQGEVVQHEIKENYRKTPVVVHDVCCYHFDDLLLHIFEIIVKEKARKSYVIPHVFAGSTIYRLALYMASCLNELNVRYVRAKDYHLVEGKMITFGVDKSTYMELPYFRITLPSYYGSAMLRLLLEKMPKAETPFDKPHVKETRKKLANEFKGLVLKDGRQPKNTSAATYTTRSIIELVEDQYLEPKFKIGQKYKLEFTDQGLLMAKIVSLKREVEKGRDLSRCGSCGGRSMFEKR